MFERYTLKPADDGRVFLEDQVFQGRPATVNFELSKEAAQQVSEILNREFLAFVERVNAKRNK